METRRIKTVDLKFREFLKNLAEAYFKDKLYPIDQTKINIELLIANQIDYKDYVSGAKGALKRFLELFPDIFLLEDRNINGGTQVYCTLNAPSIAKIEIVLGKLIVGNGGKFLLSSIPGVLSKEHGIDYHDYSQGKQFKKWLEEDFNGRFTVNGEYLFFSASLPIQSSDPNPDPESKAVLSTTIDAGAEIAQMHAFAFMSWWSNNSKTLQKYTKQAKTPEEWSSIVARAFSYTLIGVNEIYHYTIDGSSRIVFDVGVKTENGHSVFCVLQTNPLNVAGDKQRYSFVRFCCIAEEDDDLCFELKNNLPELFKAELQTKDKYEGLRIALDVIIQCNEKIAASISRLATCIELGIAIDSELFAALKTYQDKWDYINETVNSLGWDVGPDELLNSEFLSKRLEFSSRRKDTFDRAVELFVSFAEKINSYCSDSGVEYLCPTIQEDIANVMNLTVDSYSDLKALAIYYMHLMDVTNHNELNDSVAESLEIMQEHFGGSLKPRILKLAFYNQSSEDLGVESKDTPRDVIDLLTSLENIIEPEDTPEETIEIDVDELLNKVISGLETNELTLVLASAKHFCTTKLEKALAAADFSKCKAIIENDDLTEKYSKEKSVMLNSVDTLEKENNNDLTLYRIGCRLLEVIGNSGRLAERYFVLGLITDPLRCSQALADLYISNNDSENFLNIWKKYGSGLRRTSNTIKQLIYSLAIAGENELKRYLRENVELLYVEEYLSIIYMISNEYRYTEIIDLCIPRIEQVQNANPINAFERQIIDSGDQIDYDAVKNIVYSFFPLLDSLGYSKKEIDDMTGFLSSVEYDGARHLPTAILHELQGNKNGTVEALLWKSISEKYCQENCVLLIKLLSNEARYDEVCLLYECYQSDLEKVSDMRNEYLKSLIKSNNMHFYSFACKNFQECLVLISQKEIHIDDIVRLGSIYNVNGHQKEELFCSELISVCNYLDELVLSSIISISDDLREIAINTDKLVSFGLSSKSVDNFVSVYKTDAYTRDRSILGVAHRLYSFIGAVYSDSTKDIALLAQNNGYDASSLLWRIYTDLDDNDSKLDLLIKYPDCQSGREREFCALLLFKEEYERFLIESERLSDVSNVLTIQTIIAKCRLDRDVANDVKEIKDIVSIDAKWIVLMVEALLSKNHVDLAMSFLVSHFDEALSCYSESEVYALITVNGTVQDDFLKALQKKSLNESKMLSLYIFETFGIGRMKGASKDFFAEFLSNYSSSDDDTKQKLLREARIIYSKNEEYLTKIVLSDISSILTSSEDDETINRKIERAIDNTTLTSDGVLTFINLANSYDLPVSPALCIHIIQMCENTGVKAECIEFISKHIETLDDSDNLEVVRLICELYIDAIENGYFNEEWCDGAKRLCYKLLNTKESYIAKYCLFNIEQVYGNKFFADYTWYSLIEQKHEIPTEFCISKNIDLENEHSEAAVSIFDLFIKMAIESSVDEMVEYCKFCGRFVEDRVSLLKYYDDVLVDKNVDIYSKESCVVLLKLLYSDPDNIDYWQCCMKMPLEDQPSLYSKFLYIISILGNTESPWKKCIDSCERYSQEELLMSVLIDCAKRIPAPYSLQKFRVILADKVSTNPAYFSQFDSDKLTELVRILIERFDVETSPAIIHNAIRDLSAITVSTDSSRALNVLLDNLGIYLFGENSNLGLATVCHLINRKRFTEAKYILDQLSTIPTVKYKRLVSELSAMDISSIETWASKRVNAELINIILPDGNYPDIVKINELTLKYSSAEKAEDGATLMCRILDEIPNDYGCHMALFILCKQLPNRIDMLHRALCGLIKNEPVGNSKTYYKRSRKDIAVLLANVNAVIIAQNLTDNVFAFDGYDFRVSAREYYQKYENRLDDLGALAEIQEVQDNVQNVLANQSVESTAIICDIIISSVTGSWRKILICCWKDNIDISKYVNYFTAYSSGLARSILDVAYSLADSDQTAFINWVENILKDRCVGVEIVQKQTNIALDLFKKGYYTHIPHGVLEDNMLSLPFEEHSIMGMIFRNTVLQMTSKAPGYVYPCAMIVSYLTYSSEGMSECFQAAMRAFESSNDMVAHGLFNTLHQVLREANISHRLEKDTRKNGEIYESLMRISGAFSNNERIIEKISKPSFHTWSCINMIFALLYTNRANEVNRLKRYFSKDNQKVTDVILTVIDKNKNDTEKINAISSLTKEVEKALICFIACSFDKPKGDYAFLRDKNSISIIKQIQEDIAARNTSVFSKALKPKHFLWIEPSRIDSSAYEQLEEYDDLILNDAIEVYTQEDARSKELPSFVSELSASAETSKSIDELWEEHERINSFGLDNYLKRLELTKAIYQIALHNNLERDILIDYAIRYGLDYYYYCMGHKQYARANEIMLEIVSSYDSTSQYEGSRMLKNVVCNTALHELLNHGYSSIRSLVDAYVNNRQAFIKMRNILPANTMSVELDDVNIIYSALEIIAKCLSEISASHSSAYRTALDNAKKLLSDITPLGWSNLKLTVRQMIQDEINKVSQRPILSIKIINEKASRVFGCIYGQVENIGNDVAENITVQLDYFDDTSSVPYTLPKLGKGEVASFEISYSTPVGTTIIEYDVNVTYENRGEKYNYISKKERLIIESKPYEDYPSGLYITDRPIGDFELLDDGTIHSDNFFGREEEKRKINSIFTGGSFANYKNVIIKGIRRAGKTSILYYLLKYANTKCDDAVAIYITCEGIKGDNQPIQHALIDRVVKECSNLNLGNASKEEWDNFIQRWTLSQDISDRDADDLQYFYRELKTLNGGKGLMLIIDEFDILIEEVECKQGIYSSLLPSLRVLLNSVYCQEAVHLVICGSNKLIRYMDGGTFNQLFQQFGDNVIEIGKLLERDMKEMLEAPYKGYPEVEISPQALKWIWKYTNGLVWYSKLIANCALNRARSQERCVVYPTDVIDALSTVISHHDYFRSLVSSCSTKELKVLDAMQSLTSKATEYISLNKLSELLCNEFSQKDIESYINTLEMMQFVQRNPYDRLSYRFAVELYWHYFRVSPSNFERVDEIPVKFKEGREDVDYQQEDYDNF